MMIPSDPRETTEFVASLERVSARHEFLDIFYDEFMGQSEEIRALFSSTDIAHLKQKLKGTLRLSATAASSVEGGELYLQHLGRLHHRLEIGVHLYEQWLDALVLAVSRCDPEYDARIERLWRKFIGYSIDVLTAQYDRNKRAAS